eukprot:TRINITY_DN4907_c0_g1_i7.p1 TRINITY_DN4907_c0_g1~~TRINITY_DN4907_c0_g1_i7.p1  ORF type:complete len:442 (+),score=84.70 TRINITY_DN4907_c0_g1_i7:46-1371(+)
MEPTLHDSITNDTVDSVNDGDDFDDRSVSDSEGYEYNTTTSDYDLDTSYQSFTSVASSRSTLTTDSSKMEPSKPTTISRFQSRFSLERLQISPSSSSEKPSTTPRRVLSLRIDRVVSKIRTSENSKETRTKDAATREQTVMSVKQIWESDMIPHFEERRSSKQLRELSWKGIPTKFRGKVWSLAIGNAMNITEELYQIMVKNARTTREAVDAAFRRGMSEEDIDAIFPGKMNSLSLIKLDLERTFPELCFFQQGTPEYDSLRDVLEAYVAYRPDMGYVQGMSYIAGMLLLNMSAFDSFVCFVHLLNSAHMRALFRMESPGIDLRFAVFDHLLAEFLPETSKHFSELGVSSNLYVVEWFMTIFARLVNLELSSRLWDVYVMDGEVFAFRAALGILKLLSPRLLKANFEQSLNILLNISRVYFRFYSRLMNCKPFMTIFSLAI